MIRSKRAIISFTVNKVPWKMLARWAEGKEVAAALSEDAFSGLE